MPKIRRANLPPALLRHLLNRVQAREITADQLRLLAVWLDSNPEVPDGPWYKAFPGRYVCGEGGLIKTLLHPGQHPSGQRIE